MTRREGREPITIHIFRCEAVFIVVALSLGPLLRAHHVYLITSPRILNKLHRNGDEAWEGLDVTVDFHVFASIKDLLKYV